MRRSDLALRLLALGIAAALLLVVRGDKRITVTYSLPVEAALPEGLTPASPLPAEVRVAISGPWARVRQLDPAELGAVRVDLSRAVAGTTAWYAQPEALHLPRGLRVDAVHPAQGAVELLRGTSVEPSTPHP
jgi:hypothetical protein